MALLTQIQTSLLKKYYFLRKKKTQNHRNISLNNIQVVRVSHQQHLGIILDEKLNFTEYIDSTTLKVNRGIAVLKKLRYKKLAMEITNHNIQSSFEPPT